METLKKAGLAAAIMLLVCSGAHAGDTEWDDMFAPYLQRIDKATTDSGDAQNVNTATHMITPWPPYVHNRHIPGDGDRMVNAIKLYRDLHSSGALRQQQRTYNSNSTTTTQGPSATTTTAGQSSFGSQPKQ